MATALTLTEVLDNLYTSTWQNMKSTLVDNIFSATPFWFWLKDKGKLEPVEGGRFLTEPLQFATNDNIGWIGKGGTVSLQDFQFMTIAQFSWRYLVGSLVRFGVDDQQNRGKNEIISLMNSKMENTKMSLITELETRLAGAAGTVTAGTTTANGASIDGLQWLVPDDPTSASNTVGGIDPSAGQNTWWRNQATNATGKSFATYGVSLMRTMLNNCMNNLKMDAPDIILSGQTPYEYYEDNTLTYYRTSNNKLTDLGFQNIVYKGIPMIWAPSVANTRMYFLNTNFIKFAYDPMMFFDMTEWKAIPDQVNDRAAQIITAGAFKISRRKCQGVIYNIDTA
jgi:hypothetical protein